ncbi:MAG TPA: hypothetical protein VKZ74_06380 [Natronosporangium sp.]|nr:hypothetical protein [Natronosporangium sp.]
MTDDQIRAAFTCFRTEEATRLPAPDVASVHQAVHRRRRRAATGAVGGLTALLLLGAGYLAGLASADPGPGVPPAADVGPDFASTPAPEPVETDMLEPDERHQVAMAALGLDDDAWDSYDRLLLMVGRGIRSATVEDSRNPQFQLLHVDFSGEVRLRVADAAAGRGETRLTVPEGTDLSIRVEREPAGEDATWLGTFGISPSGGEQ